MTLRRQLLLLLLVHLIVALAAWDGYRIGLKYRAKETRMTMSAIGNVIWRGDWRDKVDYHISDAVRDPDTDIIYIAVVNNKGVKPAEGMTSPWMVFSRPTLEPPPERTDANWRGN